MTTGGVLTAMIQARHAARPDVRLFRNTVGDGWHGKLVVRAEDHRTVKLIPGDVVLRGGRYVKFGLATGSADLIGFRSVPVSALDPNGVVAVFASVEVKGDGDRVRSEQQAWREMVHRFGGTAIIASCVEDVDAALGAV